MKSRNGGRRPMHDAATISVIREIVAHKRHLGREASLRAGLPTIVDLAYRFHITPQVIYRICCGRKPYTRIHPRDLKAAQSTQEQISC